MRKSNIDTLKIFELPDNSVQCDSQSSQSIQARVLQMVFSRASEGNKHIPCPRGKMRSIFDGFRSELEAVSSAPSRRQSFTATRKKKLWDHDNYAVIENSFLAMVHCDMLFLRQTQNDWNGSLSEHRVQFHSLISSSYWPTRFLSNNAKEVTEYVRVQGLSFTW